MSFVVARSLLPFNSTSPEDTSFCDRHIRHSPRRCDILLDGNKHGTSDILSL
jgi:hypothetical protein